MSFLLHQNWLVVFHWRLSDSKSSQVSKILLRIQVVLNNAIVWMVSILPSISNCSSLLSRLLETVSSALTPIGITIARTFYSFFNSMARSKYLSIFLLSFMYTLWYTGMAKSRRRPVFFFFV